MISSIINIFAPVTGNLILKRVDSATTYTKGRAQPVTRTSTTITGSVQPMPQNLLLNLDELQRSRNPKVCYTKTEVLTGDKKTQQGEDIIEYQGDEYIVFGVAPLPDWNGANLAHYEVSLLRKDA